MQTINLTQRPPRSARVRLGGYVILPRLLDKCRAELEGNNGEYHYNCPLDQRFLSFTGVDAEALKAEVAKGLGDGALLNWINENATIKRDNWEIVQWSAVAEAHAPSSNGNREFINELVASVGGSEREDISTIFEALDLDDHASYGGKS